MHSATCSATCYRQRSGDSAFARKALLVQDERPEADRQLPLAGEIFLDHVGHFVRDPEAAARRAGACRFRARRRSRSRSIPIPAGGAPQLTGTGNVTAMFSRGYIEVLVQDRRHAARPRARCRHGALSGRASRGLRGGRCRRAHRRLAEARLSGAAAGRHAPPGRHRRRRRNRGLHARSRRARRDAGGPHPDPHPPDRAHGLAAALALASERRARPVAGDDRGRRRGGGGAALRALHRPRRPAARRRPDHRRSTAAASISSPPTHFAQMLPEVPIPSLPFIGAYGIRVKSLTTLDDMLATCRPDARGGASRIWSRSFPGSSGTAPGCSPNRSQPAGRRRQRAAHHGITAE